MKIIVIGSSTGGPRILFEIFSDLPVIQSAIIVIQHMPSSTTPRLAKRLSQLTSNEIIIPEDETKIQPGCIYIAKGDMHLTLERTDIIRLHNSEKVNFVRPSIDVTMFSLIPTFNHTLLGIILTGMGSDGAEGLAHMKDIGAVTAVQDPGTCTIKSMPEAAINTEKVDYIQSPALLKELIKKF